MDTDAVGGKFHFAVPRPSGQEKHYFLAWPGIRSASLDSSALSDKNSALFGIRRDRIAGISGTVARRERDGGLTVVQDRKPDVDGYLNYQFDAWARVPEHARGWNRLDRFEQEMLHLEWLGVTESRLRELDRWLKQNLFTPAQKARHAELQLLVARMRPTLEAMFSDL